MNEVIILLLIGLAAGLLSGLLGIGGGIIIIPMLVGFLGYTQKDAQGTS
ncbi:MAG: TSUP family transporter, partial [Ignavibacteria bacterium]|nr:TSUP family transporter [Ignavibacteria bacterium]